MAAAAPRRWSEIADGLIGRAIARVPPAALSAPFAAALLPAASAFDRAVEDPRAAQTSALLRIVGHLEGSRRWRALRGVRTLNDLQSSAPIAKHDALAADIDRAAAGEHDVLSTSPLVRFERSAGSSGARKLVPMTRAFLDEMNAALAPWLFDLVARTPGVGRGCAYWSISPLADAGALTPGGIPIGADDDSSYFPRPIRALLSRMLAAPPALSRFATVEACRTATLRVLLERDDLSFISVWSPTFLSLLLDALERQRESLASDLERGVLTLADPAAAALSLSAHPVQAARLRAGAGPTELWPRLALVSLWTDAASASFVADVERRLPGVPLQAKGLLATEGVVSLPYRGARPLAVSSHVLEFIPDPQPGSPAAPRALFVHELEIGRTYHVLLTTSAGLVRYRLGDRVEVTGALEATPTIRFLGRAGLVSDLVGEKLSVERVTEVLAAAVPAVRFAMLAPRRDGRGYLLIVEGTDADAGAARVDALLCEAHPYRYARELGQLATVRGVHVDGAAARYEAACIKRGQRAGEIKHTPLHLARDWEDTLGLEVTTW